MSPADFPPETGWLLAAIGGVVGTLLIAYIRDRQKRINMLAELVQHWAGEVDSRDARIRELNEDVLSSRKEAVTLRLENHNLQGEDCEGGQDFPRLWYINGSEVKGPYLGLTIFAKKWEAPDKWSPNWVIYYEPATGQYYISPLDRFQRFFRQLP